MYILYALIDGNWQEYASFKDKKNYAQRVAQASELKIATAKTEAEKNAAIIMKAFVLGNEYYAEKYGKVVKRALRHFDEVGLSNDIFDELECLLDEGCDGFALAKDSEDVSTYVAGDMEVSI